MDDLTRLCESLQRDGQTPVKIKVNATYGRQKIGKNAVKPYNIRVCEGLGLLKKWVKIGYFLGLKIDKKMIVKY